MTGPAGPEGEDVEAERERTADQLEQLRAERAHHLATRREQDLINAAIRDHDRDLHTREQDRHLAAINGSIERTEKALHAIDARLGGIESERAAERKVNAALSAHLTRQEHHAVSDRTLWLMTAAVIVAIVVPVFIALIRG